MRILAERPSWRNAVTAALVCVTMSPFVARAAVSQPVTVTRNPEQSFLWHTAPSGTFELRWVKPQGATSATLAVTGAHYSQTYENLTGESLQLSLPAASSSADENVYELVLTFDNSAVLRTVLGAVSTLGSSSASTMSVRESDRAWGLAQPPVVLPIPCGVELFRVDGVETDTGLGGDAGWYLCRSLAIGAHTLLAQTPARVFEAELFVQPGTMIIFR